MIHAHAHSWNDVLIRIPIYSTSHTFCNDTAKYRLVVENDTPPTDC